MSELDRILSLQLSRRLTDGDSAYVSHLTYSYQYNKLVTFRSDALAKIIADVSAMSTDQFLSLLCRFLSIPGMPMYADPDEYQSMPVLQRYRIAMLLSDTLRQQLQMQVVYGQLLYASRHDMRRILLDVLDKTDADHRGRHRKRVLRDSFLAETKDDDGTQGHVPDVSEVRAVSATKAAADTAEIQQPLQVQQVKQPEDDRIDALLDQIMSGERPEDSLRILRQEIETLQSKWPALHAQWDAFRIPLEEEWRHCEPLWPDLKADILKKQQRIALMKQALQDARIDDMRASLNQQRQMLEKMRSEWGDRTSIDAALAHLKQSATQLKNELEKIRAECVQVDADVRDRQARLETVFQVLRSLFASSDTSTSNSSSVTSSIAAWLPLSSSSSHNGSFHRQAAQLMDQLQPALRMLHACMLQHVEANVKVKQLELKLTGYEHVRQRYLQARRDQDRIFSKGSHP